jgi:hypothetical protein
MKFHWKMCLKFAPLSKINNEEKFGVNKAAGIRD